MSQIETILNAHLTSLQWIDQQVTGLQSSVGETASLIKQKQQQLEAQPPSGGYGFGGYHS